MNWLENGVSGIIGWAVGKGLDWVWSGVKACGRALKRRFPYAIVRREELNGLQKKAACLKLLVETLDKLKATQPNLMEDSKDNGKWIQ